jgi:c-di-AMP phosphodiesterase-like protein
VFEKKDLKSARESKFSVLESVNSIVAPSGLPVSVSIGVGVDGDSFEESYDFASLAIDMALSRGGDQAVIKDRYNFEFYGGNNKETEQRSKVNSRVSAESLMNLVSQCSQVFIMGHSNADLDSVGAALGVRCLCRKWGVDAKIILDLEHNASGALLEEILETPEYKDALLRAWMPRWNVTPTACWW